MMQTLRSAAHYDRFREFVEARSGIRLPETKNQMIETRLRTRVIACGYQTLEEYLKFLFEENGIEEECDRVIDLMTTNKTDFFRELPHFDFLQQAILPDALARARGRPVHFKVWSAAASSGAEAWSLAMVLENTRKANPNLNWAILGTDISSRVLETARRAVYPKPEIEPVPAELAASYLMTGEGKNGEPLVRIVPELRARVRFNWMNLTEMPYPVATGLDLILLRNVLIYFDEPLQRAVIHNCARHLRPGGYFFVGHSESMLVRETTLVQEAPAIFRKEAR